MVDKRRRIASKPNTPPTADAWVSSGGIDPETQQSIESLQPVVELSPSTEDKGKPYPHRVSFDMDKQQYKRLKTAAFESERAMNEILREAIENWLRTRNY